MYFSRSLLIRLRREIGRKLEAKEEAGEDLGIGMTKDDFHSRETNPEKMEIKDVTERVSNRAS